MRFRRGLFTHVGDKATFETLQASFGLADPALNRIGALMRCLDAGGIRPAGTSGIVRVLVDLQETIPEDDRLFELASGVFNELYAAFRKRSQKQ
ncbi:chromate resistance protein ChrB domain-containing protein [Methylocaldum sp. 14B]|uniref:chromate resistance protein ChrB domain-containing protein n=1 Tax=Methylocaldum sp. 14B TaxID=1912213 RepID=UPI0023E36D60|nr:chromate resistance protein ChrB domain-containing protein [Methylocaldum sp. 14B]